jgi:hypothetical protein
VLTTAKEFSALVEKVVELLLETVSVHFERRGRLIFFEQTDKTRELEPAAKLGGFHDALALTDRLRKAS